MGVDAGAVTHQDAIANIVAVLGGRTIHDTSTPMSGLPAMTEIEHNAAELIVPLDELAAHKLDSRIRRMAETVHRNLNTLAALVAEAKAGQIHQALGYPCWTVYLADALAGQWSVDREDRRELVKFLAGEGMSNRAIARIVGASEGTVRNDRSSGAQDYAPEPSGPEAINEEPVATMSRPITGLDNKTYPRSRPREKSNPKPVVTDARLESEPVYAVKQGRDPQLQIGLLESAPLALHSLAQDFDERFGDGEFEESCTPEIASAAAKKIRQELEHLTEHTRLLEGFVKATSHQAPKGNNPTTPAAN